MEELQKRLKRVKMYLAVTDMPYSHFAHLAGLSHMTVRKVKEEPVDSAKLKKMEFETLVKMESVIPKTFRCEDAKRVQK